MKSSLLFNFGGLTLLADSSGALIWPDRETLIVSDLHFEKGSSYGETLRRHLPPYDTKVTLDALEKVLGYYAPKRVICLGDSFHDGNAHARMNDEDCARLQKLTGAYDWLWIAGNHDPAPPECFGGRVESAATFGSLLFIHKAEEHDFFEISGHYHPKAAIVVRSSRVSGRCFVIDNKRLIMPAFGAYTGGLSVMARELRALLSASFSVAMIGRHRIVQLPSDRLVA